MPVDPRSLRLQVGLRSALPPELRQTLDAWFVATFPHTRFVWAERPHVVLAWCDDELVGNVAIVDRMILAGSHEVRVGGVGAVTTQEAWRGRGVGAATMQRATQYIHEELAIAFGLLLCHADVSGFYRKLGWKTVEGPCEFEQPEERTRYPRLTMVHASSIDDRWPDGLIDLRGLPW